MTCFKPIQIPKYFNTLLQGTQTVPCKRCNGCRIQKSKEWAIRCIHEAKIHGDNNAFITLTYNNDHLPKDNSLNHKHFQLFIRSLRKRTHQKIRYYMCGEYGLATEKNNYIARPHYHAILFGYSFPDRKEWYRPKMRQNNRIYRSELLEKTWTDSTGASRGFSEIGSVTFKSCAYVARYILKKQNKDSEMYLNFDRDSGEITGTRKQEYTNMSLKPGIGKKYFQKNVQDMMSDWVMIEPGKKLALPEYYRNVMEEEWPNLAAILKEKRIKHAKQFGDRSPQRLEVRDYIQGRKIDQLKRELT